MCYLSNFYSLHNSIYNIGLPAQQITNFMREKCGYFIQGLMHILE